MLGTEVFLTINHYLASNTINLLVLFLYMILYPHSRHLMASLGRISFSLKLQDLVQIVIKIFLTISPVTLSTDVDHGLFDLSCLLVTLHFVIYYCLSEILNIFYRAYNNIGSHHHMLTIIIIYKYFIAFHISR